MIDYFENYILIAYRNVILTINVRDKNIESEQEEGVRVVSSKLDEANIKALNL